MKHILETESELTCEQVFITCNACGAKTSSLTTPLTDRYESPRTSEGTDSLSGNTIYQTNPELIGCQNCGRNPYGTADVRELTKPWRSAVPRSN